MTPLKGPRVLFQKPNPEASSLQDQINAVLSRMKSFDAEDAEYEKLLAQLERLYKLQNHNPSGFRPSADAVLTVAGSVIGILLIINHEKLNVISSKAMSFIVKAK